jgi:DNA-binding MarR family transcriptional regulator
MQRYIYHGVVTSRSPAAEVAYAMAAIGRRQRSRQLARDRGVSASDANLTLVLDAVASSDAPTVGSVALALSVDQPRASRLVASAVDAGLLERHEDPADARRTLLQPTPHGRRHLTAVQRTRERAMAHAMADWTDTERVQFARLLSRFLSGLSRG